uniref:Uncharacterized protein n=1 Tax=Caenorhabditis japonica TaxID=281687 RepID=A0A8R1HUR1_CAEJA
MLFRVAMHAFSADSFKSPISTANYLTSSVFIIPTICTSTSTTTTLVSTSTAVATSTSKAVTINKDNYFQSNVFIFPTICDPPSTSTTTATTTTATTSPSTTTEKAIKTSTRDLVTNMDTNYFVSKVFYFPNLCYPLTTSTTVTSTTTVVTSTSETVTTTDANNVPSTAISSVSSAQMVCVRTPIDLTTSQEYPVMAQETVPSIVANFCNVDNRTIPIELKIKPVLPKHRIIMRYKVDQVMTPQNFRSYADKLNDMYPQLDIFYIMYGEEPKLAFLSMKENSCETDTSDCPPFAFEDIVEIQMLLCVAETITREELTEYYNLRITCADNDDECKYRL